RVLFVQRRLLGHLFLVELAGANNHFHGKSSPRNLASTPFFLRRRKRSLAPELTTEPGAKP
ncbi:hypothetical protein A3010_14055, partial [Salmonella enterica subsp. enterica serovar Bredeney]|nr:hypothetical protein [Salmonella enterica subsp. enterica serovar Bredeney]